MRVFFLFLITILLSAGAVGAQTSSGSASLTSADSSRIDTNYIKFYKDKLILALWGSKREFDVLLAPNPRTVKIMGDSVNFIANSNNVTGVSLDYDIIGFSFGFRSVPSGTKRTGNTDYLDLGLNINTRGLRFELSWKRYTGFYDAYTPKYTPSFHQDTLPYTQFPTMNIRVIKSKLIYSFNKRKFALGAAYANAKRQVKGAGSWLMVGNFYALNLYSDSSIIPVPLQTHFGTKWDGLNKMNVYAFSVGFGGTRSFIIFKRVSLNLFASIGIEEQYRHFYNVPENDHVKYWKTWFSGDWRTSLGYNSKRFFMRSTAIYDITNYGSQDLQFEMKFIAVSFDFGYRFNFKVPKPYRKFQETKIYKML